MKYCVGVSATITKKYPCELTLVCQRSAEPVWSRLDLDELDCPDSNPLPCQNLPCLDTFSIHP